MEQRGEGELGGRGVFYLLVFTVVAPRNCERLKQKLPPQLTSGDATGDKIAYCKCLLFLCFC